MSIFLDARDVSKKYGTIQALNKVSFQAEKGCITGLIGPDGAGKTSLLKIILTLLKRDEGSVLLEGKDPQKNKKNVRERVGYMPEVFSLYPDLTVEENLLFSYRIHKIREKDFQQRLEKLFRFNRLDNFRKTRAAHLSGGMKQKLALSCALIHEPEFLILDEPTTGVDPLSRREFWQMLADLKESGLTILVSTPYMDEAMLCDSIGLFYQGHILAEGPPRIIIGNFKGTLCHFETGVEEIRPVRDFLRQTFPDTAVFLSGKQIRLFSHEELPISELEGSLKGFSVKVSRAEADLEDVFLSTILLKGKQKEAGQ